MNIHREGKYLVGSDLKKRLLLGIESANLDECIAEAIRRKAYGVFGHPEFGFKEINLDFLASLPRIRSIWFWDIALKSVDGIYALKNLKSFGVHTKRPAIDFSRLRTLEEAVWFYCEKDRGLAALESLRVLSMWHYKPKHRSFDGLELPQTLEELDIAWANPPTLAGLPVFPRLKRLKIARMRNLESLAELPRIAPHVEHLVVTTCPRVADGKQVVGQLPQLRHAFVQSAVLVSR